MTFKDDCDRAYNLVSSCQHIGSATFQYELNLPRRRLLEVLEYLGEKYGAVEYYCGFHDGFCILTKEDMVRSEEADARRKEANERRSLSPEADAWDRIRSEEARRKRKTL